MDFQAVSNEVLQATTTSWVSSGWKDKTRPHIRGFVQLCGGKLRWARSATQAHTKISERASCLGIPRAHRWVLKVDSSHALG